MSLVGMVLATTVVVYLRLWLDRLQSADTYQQCVAGLSGLSGQTPFLLVRSKQSELAESLVAEWVRCGRPYATMAVVSALAGLAGVAVVAGVAYLAMPWWRIRRRRLQPLHRVHSPDLHSYLDDLVQRMGLASCPVFWLAPQAAAVGVAFGRHGRAHVQLNAGLLKKYQLDRPAFTAVVMHELAHIRNGDIRYTYLTIATWWAFVVVALVPYAAAGVLSATIDQTAISVLAMTVLAYLVYTSILRTREVHADATAASVGGGVGEQLKRVLDQALSLAAATEGTRRGVRSAREWPALRRHPSLRRRLAMLDDPSPLFSTGVAPMVGAGIAIAAIQANLTYLTSQVLLVLTPADGSSTWPLPTLFALASLLTFGLSTGLIAAVACITMWRARLRGYPDLPPVAWFRPAAALSVGLLLGEPLSVYFGGMDVWGLFDGLGFGVSAVGVVGAVLSASELVFGISALLVWMSECAAVWVQVTRASLRRVGFIASVVGALAFCPAYSSWSWLHDTGMVITVQNYAAEMPAWTSRWKPPGMSLVYADYLPVFLISAVPGVAVLLALPCLFLVAGAVRRPPPTTPRWLDAAGAGTAGVRAPRWPRPPVGAAMLTGLATALVCLAATFGLATLVWFRTGGASGPNSEGSAAYLILATVALAVAFSAVSASIVAARARQGAATLAILAALVTTGLVAIVAPLLAGVGMCGPAGAVTQAGCRGAISGTAGLAYGVPIVLGVPRTVVIASMAVAATAVLRRLARVLRRRAAGIDPPGATRTSEAQPSPLQQAWLLALTGAVVANLAIGGYVGYGFFFGW